MTMYHAEEVNDVVGEASVVITIFLISPLSKLSEYGTVGGSGTALATCASRLSPDIINPPRRGGGLSSLLLLLTVLLIVSFFFGIFKEGEDCSRDCNCKCDND